MLIFENVTKKYADVAAVDSFSLHVPDGKTTVLIGPSGCGKSTILRLIIGLIFPYSGIITFQNNVIDKDSVLDLRKSMGYVIQEGGLFPHLTASQNITLMASYLKWTLSDIDYRLSELVELTQFPTEGLDRYPAQLSGGQRQRISLMRALMLDPDLLLMDEPLGALDPMIRIDFQIELKSIFQKLEKTVLLVTHDLGEAGYLGDSLVLMREGQIVQQGPLESLVKSPVTPFVTRFVNAQRSPLENIQGGENA